jgi:hypothetical protein
LDTGRFLTFGAGSESTYYNDAGERMDLLMMLVWDNKAGKIAKVYVLVGNQEYIRRVVSHNREYAKSSPGGIFIE